MTKLLHIGLGKCGSTFLQKKIFPKIAEKIGINYINAKDNIYFRFKKKIKIHIFENFKNLEKKLPNEFILSKEGIFSTEWEFSRIEKSFNYVKENFSSDTVILIVIRNPYNLLNSIYCQSIRQMRIVKPENFFYVNKDEINIRVNNKFNLYNFDYSKIISLYKNYFKKVIVVKYENLNDFNFLKAIFDLDDNFIKELKKDNDILLNRTISKLGIDIILFLNNFFNVQKNQEFIRSQIKPSNKIIGKIKNFVLAQFLLDEFFQKKFDKIVPYKKYYIKKNYIPIDIDNEIRKYDLLKY